jgi:hypothetical protein
MPGQTIAGMSVLHGGLQCVWGILRPPLQVERSWGMALLSRTRTGVSLVMPVG